MYKVRQKADYIESLYYYILKTNFYEPVSFNNETSSLVK